MRSRRRGSPRRSQSMRASEQPRVHRDSCLPRSRRHWIAPGPETGSCMGPPPKSSDASEVATSPPNSSTSPRSAQPITPTPSCTTTSPSNQHGKPDHADLPPVNPCQTSRRETGPRPHANGSQPASDAWITDEEPPSTGYNMKIASQEVIGMATAKTATRNGRTLVDRLLPVLLPVRISAGLILGS